MTPDPTTQWIVMREVVDEMLARNNWVAEQEGFDLEEWFPGFDEMCGGIAKFVVTQQPHVCALALAVAIGGLFKTGSEAVEGHLSILEASTEVRETFEEEVGSPVDRNPHVTREVHGQLVAAFSLLGTMSGMVSTMMKPLDGSFVKRLNEVQKEYDMILGRKPNG